MEALALYTVDEFEALVTRPENRERLLELINGVIVEKMPTEEHGIIAAKLTIFLGNHVYSRQLGRVGVEVSYQRPNDKYNRRLPDVSFRSGESPVVKKGSVPQMPELAAEIQSPDDAVRDMREKAHYYLYNGSKLVWLVYPANKTIEVCTLDSEGEISVVPLGENETLTGGDLLPEFTVAVKEIFEV